MSPEILQSNSVRPEEEEAMWLVWETRGHTRSDEIPESDAELILREIRERAAASERKLLRGAARIVGESRYSPRKSMFFALIVVLPLAFILIVLVITMFGGFK